MITQERVKELLNYDEDTGVFTWLYSNNSILPGAVAGSLSSSGKRTIYIEGRSYAAQRVAWLYVHGVWPNQIDHENGIRFDNRFKNFRNVTNAINSKNKKIGKNNKSGVMGVYFDLSRSRWAATIRLDYKKIFLGRHIDWFEAVCARKSAEYKYGYHKNHGRQL